MEIFAIITGILTIPVVLLAGRYNLHMFQLNTYMNGEQRAWLGKNHGRQRMLLVLLVLGVLNLVRPTWVGLVLQLLAALIAWRFFLYLKQINTKKDLVYTARVKRMIATAAVLCVLLPLILVPLLGWSALAGAVAIAAAAQFVIFMVANTLNKPIEASVRNWYINDAKKKLDSMPDLTVIGVTGSYGKTSLKFYLQTLLQTRYNVLVTPASYNTPMGIVITVREHLRPGHQIFVCEMGARYEGEIKEVCDIARPDHGVITSIGPQHLDTFHDMETIVRTKFELADALPKDGMLFLNGDNLYIESNADRYGNVTFYRSESDGTGYRASDLSLSQSGTKFTVTAASGESEVFQTKLVGAHNVINITGAIAVAHKMGIPLAELRVPVRRIRPVAHRMEMKEKDGVTIIDDAYNSNPVGSKAAVETMKLLDGVRILITPGMVELGDDEEEYNYKFGTYAAASCDYVCLIGRRHTEPIRRGLLDSGFPEEHLRVYENLEDAMSYARSIRDEGHKFILLENDLPDNY